MSFREFLTNMGFNPEQADSICLAVENEIPLTELEEDLYWQWWNQEWLGVKVTMNFKGEK